MASPIRRIDTLSSGGSLFKSLAELDGSSSVDAQNMRVCHVCFVSIPNTRTYCISCGHPLCKTCTCPVPEGAEGVHKAFEASGGVHLTIHDGDTLTSYNRSVPPSPTKESADAVAVAEAETSSQHTTRQYGRAEDAGRTALATTFFLTSRSPGTPCVKENPFIIADQRTRSGPTTQTSQTIRRGATNSDCVSHRSDDDYRGEVCDNITYQVTHPEYQQDRHDISYTGYSSSSSSTDYNTQTQEPTKHYPTLDRPASSAREQRRTDTYEHYPKHPQQHSPVGKSSALQTPHRHRREKPSISHLSRSHSHDPEDEYDVQTQKPPAPPRLIRSPQAQLRSQEAHPTGTSDRLRSIQTKSSPALAQLWRQPEPSEDFREVRGKLRPSGVPSKQKPGRKNEAGEALSDARVRLSHYKPPLKATSTTNGPSEMEERLGRTRSEGQMGMEEGMRRGEGTKKKTMEEDRVRVLAGASPPGPGIVLAKETPSGGTRRSGRHKCESKSRRKKGKEAVREPPPEPQLFEPTLTLRAIEGQGHQCDWKEKYITLRSEVEGAQGQPDVVGLEGLTIVLHMKGKDDFVIDTDLRDLYAQWVE